MCKKGYIRLVKNLKTPRGASNAAHASVPENDTYPYELRMRLTHRDFSLFTSIFKYRKVYMEKEFSLRRDYFGGHISEIY